MNKKALIVGGNSGIGLATAQKLITNGYEHIYVVGKDEVAPNDITLISREEFDKKTTFFKLNLVSEEYSLFDEIRDIDTLIITAGFGRVALFEDLTEVEISNIVKCNTLSIMRIIKKYYDMIRSQKDFYCYVMGSIAGHVTSPLFSVYGASKSALCSFIQSVNSELEHDGYKNCILEVSPGSLKGTNFNGCGNKLDVLSDFVDEVLNKMYNREKIFIPQYDEIFKNVIERNAKDPIKYGLESYDYKLKNGRVSTKPQVVIGYLSGTFDLFHIGHLNLLRRAKRQCDYLIVGVHESGAWKGKETYIPFEERKEIVASIKYVDKVVKSFPEDSDAYDAFKIDKLFVGSDYKGTERFAKYEEYFADKGVEIVYFPYTKATSSTQLRKAISNKTEKQ